MHRYSTIHEKKDYHHMKVIDKHASSKVETITLMTTSGENEKGNPDWGRKYLQRLLIKIYK